MVYDIGTITEQSSSLNNFILIIVIILTIAITSFLLYKSKDKFLIRGAIFGAIILPVLFWVSTLFVNPLVLILLGFSSSNLILNILSLSLFFIVIGGIIGTIEGLIFKKFRTS